MGWQNITDFRWVEGPFKLAIGPCPDPRDVDSQMRELVRRGVEILVSLQEQDEARQMGLEYEPARAAEAGLIFRRLPVPDHDVPPDNDAALELADELLDRLRAGRGVMLHCYAGLGRSATLALLVMTRGGIELREAVRRLSLARGFPVPESSSQLEWVASLLPGSPAG